MVHERKSALAWRLDLGDDLDFITLTQLPTDFTSARWQINNLVSRYRQLGYLEALWVIEPNPRATGHHAHMLAFHERTLDPGRLRERWGGREVDVRPAVPTDAGYLLKNAYSNLESHLRLNQWRLEHHTRRFFMDVPVREAEHLAHRRRTTDKANNATGAPDDPQSRAG